MSLIPLAATAQAPKPLRQLVYAFTWGTSTDLQMQNSGMTESGGTTSSGMSDFGGSNQDKGTIAVDVLREQPDRGLVVSVSEAAQGTRSAPPATCVVYGSTNVLCDPRGKVNAEELTLVRLLAPTFVDPAQIDSRQHWRVQQNAPGFSTVSDFTISENANGQLKIVETRTISGKGAEPYKSDVTSAIGYDLPREVPTSIVEDSTQRTERANQNETVKSQTTLLLRNDSMTVKPQ